EFLGANLLADQPFIVMPLLKNGNARDFVEAHLAADCTRILLDVSRGLLYLHEKGVIHGDIKAVNILIDDGQRAVLCDFGLSRIKADLLSRSLDPSASWKLGSCNWMAPERLLGGSLRKSVGMYVFGMTIFEVWSSPFCAH
ncbi:hypothetical protein JAAARDRAFT_142113, partial [Jaapia argillacea MUCL 33604]